MDGRATVLVDCNTLDVFPESDLSGLIARDTSWDGQLHPPG